MNKIIYAGWTSFNGEWQTGRCYEIIIPQVHGKVLANGGEVRFRAGQTVILPPYVKRAFKPEGRHLHVKIEQALLPFKEVTVISDDGAQGIAHAAKQAAEYFSSGCNKKELVISALGDLLTAYAVAFSTRSDYSPVVEMIKADLMKNVSDAFYTPENFLKSLPLNYDYARKLFKKETGVTPHGYLLQQRMQLAAGLLSGGKTNKYSRFSVSQVAEACGFAEPLYFSRVFKKYYGISPSEYGKNC